MSHAEKKVNSNLAELATVRDFVRQVCDASVLDEKSADLLELALTETTSNVIRHAYNGRTDGRIEISAETYADRVVVKLYHWGLEFHPEPQELPRLDTGREGGYGLYIIEHSVDKLRYLREKDGRNCIVLAKYRNNTERKVAPQKIQPRSEVMELRVEKVGDVSVVKVPGRSLDASNVEEFKRDVQPILDESNQVVLDIRNLDFVDSSGLGAFLSCLRKLNAKGGDLKIAGMTKAVRALFEVVRMHRICDSFETVDEAVKASE